MASSSHTIVHWSHPIHNSSLTQATASSPPFSLARSSARIAFIIIRIRFCSRDLRAARSGIPVILIDAIGHDFSRLRLEYQISLKAIIAVLSQSVWQGKILHREFRSRV